MTDQATAPARAGKDVPATIPPSAMDQAVEAYEGMLAAVPEGGDDAGASILLAIAQANDVRQLDAPWRSEGLREYVDVPLEIRAIRKAPSEYEGGIPWFLIIDAVDLQSGQLVTLTTGAVSVVAQLVRAYTLGRLPIQVIPREAQRAAPGRNPAMHLEIAG